MALEHFLPLPGKMTQYPTAPAVAYLKEGNQERGFRQSSAKEKNCGKNPNTHTFAKQPE